MTITSMYVQRGEEQHIPTDPDQLRDDILFKINDAGANSVKIEGSFSVPYEFRRFDKTTRIVCRHIAVLEGDDSGGFKQDYKPGEADPLEAAKVHTEILLAHAEPRESIFWESPYNEPGFLEDPAMMKWLSDFEVERQRLYRDFGYRAAIGCFSAQANLYDKIEPFLPAIRVCVTDKNLLDLHGYNSPTLQDQGASGHDVNDFLYPHRNIVDTLARLGEPIPAFFYGEFGYDQIYFDDHPEWNKGVEGYRAAGIDNPTMAAMLADAISIVDNLEHPADKYVIGIAPFLYSDWEEIQPTYNLKWARRTVKGQDPDTGAAYLLLQWMSWHKGDPRPFPSGTATPPVPIPAPSPTPTPPPVPDDIYAKVTKAELAIVIDDLEHITTNLRARLK